MNPGSFFCRLAHRAAKEYRYRQPAACETSPPARSGKPLARGPEWPRAAWKPAPRCLNLDIKTVHGRPTGISEHLPLDRRGRLGHNGSNRKPPGALHQRRRGPTGARGGLVSPTAGVIRGPATMVAADSDSDRGSIAAFQCPVAARAAVATATGGAVWLRERA